MWRRAPLTGLRPITEPPDLRTPHRRSMSSESRPIHPLMRQNTCRGHLPPSPTTVPVVASSISATVGGDTAIEAAPRETRLRARRRRPGCLRPDVRPTGWSQALDCPSHMGVGEVADVNVVADAGAVGGRTIVAEDLDRWLASHGREHSLTRLHQLRGLGDAKVLKSLGHSPKGRHYRG